MIRWDCPNGCPGVLGPYAPPKRATCRVCLACSADSVLLVEREPTARNKVASRKEAQRRLRLEAARAKRAARARANKQVEAIDYHVTRNGKAHGTYDDLRDALRAYWDEHKTGAKVALARVRDGRLDVACFHGKLFAGWETPTGKRIASTSRS